ncbi:hypothetical protein TTHERM_000011209 (macronuclear) [Tetrahymena thermophila SB210]|uniref:Uncharacterized protein n=1 Tax=Tetrahymena thermophila (strain SB210) TaxID=312017 RepID=W7XKA2_TETTS|nr:hypothetical protein TTHERM_000011209 [Tetrahymena thermophila SB210]EWS76326.1 hypothetical protein TTHERM_000011209 [Tetrahymena thermophila SB210]|eukprot:XP_012651110.1 hypothetical protein TTHERM_000011209 [Tetrahymena thermophila SB210]
MEGLYQSIIQRYLEWISDQNQLKVMEVCICCRVPLLTRNEKQLLQMLQAHINNQLHSSRSSEDILYHMKRLQLCLLLNRINTRLRLGQIIFFQKQYYLQQILCNKLQILCHDNKHLRTSSKSHLQIYF